MLVRKNICHTIEAAQKLYKRDGSNLTSQGNVHQVRKLPSRPTSSKTPLDYVQDEWWFGKEKQAVLSLRCHVTVWTHAGARPPLSQVTPHQHNF